MEPLLSSRNSKLLSQRLADIQLWQLRGRRSTKITVRMRRWSTGRIIIVQRRSRRRILWGRGWTKKQQEGRRKMKWQYVQCSGAVPPGRRGWLCGCTLPWHTTRATSKAAVEETRLYTAHPVPPMPASSGTVCTHSVPVKWTQLLHQSLAPDE